MRSKVTISLVLNAVIFFAIASGVCIAAAEGATVVISSGSQSAPINLYSLDVSQCSALRLFVDAVGTGSGACTEDIYTEVVDQETSVPIASLSGKGTPFDNVLTPAILNKVNLGISSSSPADHCSTVTISYALYCTTSVSPD